MSRHPAGRAHYAGDRRGIVGEIKGPTTFGSYVVAVAAEFDAEANTSTVYFAYLPQTGTAKTTVDEFGTRHLVEVIPA